MLPYDLGPPTLFPVRNGSPLSVFLHPVCIARHHLLAGEGVGGPKSYDSTESLVLYMLYSLYDKAADEMQRRHSDSPLL